MRSDITHGLREMLQIGKENLYSIPYFSDQDQYFVMAYIHNVDYIQQLFTWENKLFFLSFFSVL
jgi:hypothetical protein